MKRYVTSLIVGMATLGLVSWAAFAQPASNSPQARHEPIKLSDQQKAKIKTILQDAVAKVDQAGTLRDARGIMRETLKRMRTEVLTQEQQEQLQHFRQKMHERMGKMREKVQNMSPQERQAFREKMRQRFQERLNQRRAAPQPAPAQ